jgi:hypothetical protein
MGVILSAFSMLSAAVRDALQARAKVSALMAEAYRRAG